MPDEHSHVMGGSTAAKRINCPGSLKLEAAAPPRPESDYAKQGTVFHTAMELLIAQGVQTLKEARKALSDLVGDDLGYGEEWAITQEQVDEKIIPALKAWFQVMEGYDLQDWFIEQKLSLEQVIPGAFGTADILARDSSDRLHVLDWKFGDGVPVPVEGNMGLGFYAGAALYDQEDEIVDFTEDLKGIVLHIVQPRRGSSEDPLQTWETTEDWVESFVDQAEQAMILARSDDPPLKTGDWCRWCAAKATCPAQAKQAGEALSKAPEAMTAIELGEMLHMADQVKVWADAVYDLALKELEKGAAVPGYKLVQKRATRRWKDPDTVVEFLRKKRVKKDDVYKMTVITPAQAEKKFPRLYSSTLANEVISQSSGVTVVPDTDKREAVTGSMELLANALGTSNIEQET